MIIVNVAASWCSEEIAGDIRDELFWLKIQKIDVQYYIIVAKIWIDSVNQLLSIDIAHEDIDTIGGWFMSKIFDILEAVCC